MADEKMIITIGREHGTMGDKVAEKIRRQFELPLYDKAHLLRIVEETDDYDELNAFFNDRKVNSLLYAIAMSENVSSNDVPFGIIKKIIGNTGGVVMDSCGIQAVEQIADLAEKEMEREVLAEGCHLTWRFSPGYGDLPLETQRELIRVLDTHRKIGVSLTGSCLMMPSKSVTAILGISDTRRDERKNKCDFCNNRERCAFRKRGTRC